MESKKQLIEKINNQLINDNKEINIIEYGKLLNSEIYNIDISFMKFFILLIDKEDCCIDYKVLEQMKIINYPDSNKFLCKLLKNKFKEDVDFRAEKVFGAAPTGGLTYRIN